MDRARRKYAARYPGAWCGPRAEAVRGLWRWALTPGSSLRLPGAARRVLGKFPNTHWNALRMNEEEARLDDRRREVMARIAADLPAGLTLGWDPGPVLRLPPAARSESGP